MPVLEYPRRHLSGPLTADRATNRREATARLKTHLLTALKPFKNKGLQ